MRILLAVEPVDFRKGIDGLAGVCRTALAQDPFSGYLCVQSIYCETLHPWAGIFNHFADHL
jgi:hypothetical protein